MTSGIYTITNTANGKRYVGSSHNARQRWWQHTSSLDLGKHHSRYLQRAWNKYGAESFCFDVLEYVPENQLIEREQYWIDTLRAANPRYGYNISPTAGRTAGVKASDETRRKQSETRKGKPPSARQLAYWDSMKGRAMPEWQREHIARLAKLQRGKPKTEAAKAAAGAGIRESWKHRKGRSPTERQIAGRQAYSQKMRGRKKPDEWVAKMRGRKQSPEWVALRTASMRATLARKRTARLATARLPGFEQP